jgi:hypothetical protein
MRTKKNQWNASLPYLQFKKALQSSFWVENGALWELRLLNLNVIDIDLFLNSQISIIGRCGRKKNLWSASLPYLTTVSLPPSKENHTVSYVKRVLGGGALYSAV